MGIRIGPLRPNLLINNTCICSGSFPVRSEPSLSKRFSAESKSINALKPGSIIYHVSVVRSYPALTLWCPLTAMCQLLKKLLDKISARYVAVNMILWQAIGSFFWILDVVVMILQENNIFIYLLFFLNITDFFFVISSFYSLNFLSKEALIPLCTQPQSLVDDGGWRTVKILLL